MSHNCHAAACETPVPPRMFMCAPHWRKVPKPLQNLIWLYYKPGQERRGGVTWEYLFASQRIVEWLADKEGVEMGHRMSDDFAHSADEDCIEKVIQTIRSLDLR